ncbi:hypothetical protein M011DRAFT_469889 [Sporormia fimetaria CBS 119925]|uniref:Uncharacterized protein n=1 Tax=Sporormia fimetaria CBS 119925 TaxID=1340428 RepID=A0A6A6V642_9PLEO|nr:hypothetical protein M011DRAFT_469889 [Sporormia fimetaria CBS 119925]
MNNPPAGAVAATANSGPHPTASVAAAPTSSAARPPADDNGQPPRPKRRRPKADPMRAPRRPLKQISRPVMPMSKLIDSAPTQMGGDAGVPVQTLREEYLNKGAVSMPLVMKRSMIRDLRYHIMRLQSRNAVDIEDSKQFTQPIRLHRRDPRAPPGGAGSNFAEEETIEDIEEQKERERIEIAREEKRKQREEIMSKVAPGSFKKRGGAKKKIEQKYREDDTPEAEKRRLLKYEETLPWHLEDFENKQTWVGTYESELSEAHLMMRHGVENGQDVMQMVPLERWYRFIVKSLARNNPTDNGDDPIKRETKGEKGKVYDLLAKFEKRSIKREMESTGREARGLRMRMGGGDDDEELNRRRPIADDDAPIVKKEMDADDIDFNLEEDFADDEEGINGLFEGDETEVKDAAERLRRDQLAAAAFELRNEDDVYRQEERERKEAEERRAMEKSLRKALVKREKNFDYESDESNPYESSTDSSDTDSEAEREQAKAEEERKAAEANGKPEGDKAASGASTMGSNTPANRKKRPGSPNLSEASGNESTRKKLKHEKKSRLQDVRRTATSGSDTDMASRSAVRRANGTPSGTPGASRAASPAAQPNGSRAASPTAHPRGNQDYLVNPSPNADPHGSGFPTAKEIYDALPKEGLDIHALIAIFRGRLNRANHPLFTKMVKVVSVFDKEKNLLTPLPQMPSEEVIQKRLQAKTASAAASPSA